MMKKNPSNFYVRFLGIFVEGLCSNYGEFFKSDMSDISDVSTAADKVNKILSKKVHIS